jgi:opacity protein-like surface antigen
MLVFRHTLKQTKMLRVNKYFFILKSVLIIALFFSFKLTTKAQVRQAIEAMKPKKEFTGTPILTKKSQVLQIGLGAPNNVSSLLNLGGFGSFLSTDDEAKTGPFFISYEYLIKENIGIGATLSYAKGRKTYTNPFSSSSTERYTAELSGISLLLSSTYHFYITDKLDPYAKGSIGVTLWKGSFTDQNNKEVSKLDLPTPLGYSALVGLRYFVSPNIAPFGEVSYSNLRFTVNAGVAFKL